MVIMVYIASGTKFLPVIVSKVPPRILPELGEMPEMYTSYAKSFAVSGTGTALPKPVLMTFTLNLPGKPPGIPTLSLLSVAYKIFILYTFPVELVMTTCN